MANDNDPIPKGFRRDLLSLLPPDMSWIMVGELLDKSRPLIEDNAVMEWYTRVANRVLARGERQGRTPRTNIDHPPAMRLSAGRRHLIVRTLKSGIGIDVECNGEDGLKTAFRLLRPIVPPDGMGIARRAEKMTGTEITRFDYGALSPTIRDEVKMRTNSIRARMQTLTQDIIDIGTDLIAVKEVIGHGGFTPWLSAEFGWDERTARNYMAVAERFGGKTETVSDLAPSVLYLLAGPSVPDAAVEEAVTRAKGGEKIDKRKAAQIREKHRPVPPRLSVKLVPSPPAIKPPTPHALPAPVGPPAQIREARASTDPDPADDGEQLLLFPTTKEIVPGSVEVIDQAEEDEVVAGEATAPDTSPAALAVIHARPNHPPASSPDDVINPPLLAVLREAFRGKDATRKPEGYVTAADLLKFTQDVRPDLDKQGLEDELLRLIAQMKGKPRTIYEIYIYKPTGKKRSGRPASWGDTTPRFFVEFIAAACPVHLLPMRLDDTAARMRGLASSLSFNGNANAPAVADELELIAIRLRELARASVSTR